MQNWIPFFVVVTALAVVLQVAILLAIYLQFRRTSRQFSRLMTDLQARIGPILTRLQILIEDTHPRISHMIADASHVVYLARTQAQKVDRVFTEGADRLRAQLVHVDRILTGALETVEDAGSKFRSTVWEPMQKASAVLKGIKVGLDFFRTRKRPPSNEPAEPQQEEELFI